MCSPLTFDFERRSLTVDTSDVPSLRYMNAAHIHRRCQKFAIIFASKSSNSKRKRGRRSSSARRNHHSRSSLVRIVDAAVRDDVRGFLLGAVYNRHVSVSNVSQFSIEHRRDLPGESSTFATLSSPRPLRSRMRVVEACATMCPPIGLRPSALAKMALAPGSDWTWLVMKTVRLNS